MTWDVLIVDTLGELAQLYAICDTAFIGGSLVPWGGQNLLEPAFYEKPIFFGSHMDNFSHLADTFTEHGAARIVKDMKDLLDMFVGRDQTDLDLMGQKAKDTLNSFQGATTRALEVIEAYMRED